MKLSKAYEPKQYESDIYKLWEISGAFKPAKTGEPYTIVMPPPNANANLHTGHALFMAIQDVAIRYQRMQGKAALWLPGADHAGFETWVVYEKQLNKEGKTRFDFTREELYRQVWDFVQLNKTNYESQFRSLGASCDWSRFTFTLDDKVVKTAYKVFKQMWDDKLIYRGERIVNYCTYHGTSFSDYEVVYKDQKSFLWHLRFPLVDGTGSIIVATTRPETMVGDVAVAVNPKDERYTSYIGKTVRLPLTNREIPIIADEFVDMEFGTGAVKITPAHDPNDFDVVTRHDLPRFSVIGFDGLMNHNAPEPYRGLTTDEARKQIVEDLKVQDLLEKEEPYDHSVGHCYKCDTVIQPLLKDQWFVNMKPLAQKAIAALEANQISFYPESKQSALIQYLKGIKDWNISRQIAWGIPIPAFQNVNDPDEWIFDERVEEEFIERGGEKYHRDPDVFDTWFSSGQWPYTTLGFPDSPDFERFYPTNLMETGGEILFSWVARMIMLGLYVTGDIPFKEVYIHGNVLAQDGTKMSKSKGNTINPIEEIEKYGSDALRIGMISGRTAGAHQAYTPAKVVGGRNFANKLWNIARYIEGVLGDDYQYLGTPEPKNLADYWILERLSEASTAIAKYLDEHQFALAFERIYDLVWNELADWYIEASKSAVNKDTLAFALDTVLRVTHPFAPFVTETIWQTLEWEKGSLLITREWPQIGASGHSVRDFTHIQEIVTEVRQLKTSLNLAKPVLHYQSNELINENEELIKKLASLSELVPVQNGDGLQLTTSFVNAWLSVDEEKLEAYKKRLHAEHSQTTASISRLEARLNNTSYVQSAPESIVSQTKAQLKESQEKLEKLDREIARFVP